MFVNILAICKHASFLASYGKEDEILGGLLRAINTLSAEDNCHQIARSLMQNETIFLEFSPKYDDGAL